MAQVARPDAKKEAALVVDVGGTTVRATGSVEKLCANAQTEVGMLL